MCTITHPVLARHHLVGVIVTAAATAGITVSLTLAFGVSGSSSPAVHLARANPAQCQELANATPGSPAAFRLADAISTEGLC